METPVIKPTIEKVKRVLSPESKLRKVRTTLNNLAEKHIFNTKQSKRS